MITWNNPRWSNDGNTDQGERIATIQLAQDLGDLRYKDTAHIVDLFDMRYAIPGLDSPRRTLGRYSIDRHIQEAIQPIHDHPRALKRARKTIFVMLAPYGDVDAMTEANLHVLGLGARRIPNCWYGHGTIGFLLWRTTTWLATEIAAAMDAQLNVPYRHNSPGSAP